jgi:hypothetical protein
LRHAVAVLESTGFASVTGCQAARNQIAAQSAPQRLLACNPQRRPHERRRHIETTRVTDRDPFAAML